MTEHRPPVDDEFADDPFAETLGRRLETAAASSATAPTRTAVRSGVTERRRRRTRRRTAAVGAAAAVGIVAGVAGATRSNDRGGRQTVAAASTTGSGTGSGGCSTALVSTRSAFRRIGPFRLDAGQVAALRAAGFIDPPADVVGVPVLLEPAEALHLGLAPATETANPSSANPFGVSPGHRPAHELADDDDITEDEARRYLTEAFADGHDALTEGEQLWIGSYAGVASDVVLGSRWRLATDEPIVLTAAQSAALEAADVVPAGTTTLRPTDETTRVALSNLADRDLLTPAQVHQIVDGLGVSDLYPDADTLTLALAPPTCGRSGAGPATVADPVASTSTTASTTTTEGPAGAASTTVTDPGQTTTSAPSVDADPCLPPIPSGDGTWAPSTGDPVATLRIPAIDVDATVRLGVGDDVLSGGPGLYPDAPLPGQCGNVAIAGHRTTNGAVFQRLNELGAGDTIEVATVQGDATYEVTGSAVVDPDDTAVLDDAGDNRLTLITLAPAYSASQRLVVTARLVSTTATPSGQ